MGKSYIISSISTAFQQREINNLIKILELNSSDPSEDMIYISALEKKNTIGIEQLNELRKWSKAKPYRSHSKLAVIMEADKMTVEAQNSILKMLEEPNESNNYILITAHHDSLLETILSRCELILDNNQQPEIIDIQYFLKMSLLERIGHINKISNQKDPQQRNAQINEMLKGLLIHYRMKLKLGEDVTGQIKVINQTKNYLDTNVSAKNALMFLCLNIDRLN